MPTVGLRMDSPWIHKGPTTLRILGSLCAGLFPVIQNWEVSVQYRRRQSGRKEREKEKRGGKRAKGRQGGMKENERKGINVKK